jgi:hypothetical protein
VSPVWHRERFRACGASWADSWASRMRCSQLDKKIESGTLKLIDEKKSLNEISLLRRSLTSLTKLTTLEESIASDRSQVDELKKTLDDPESKRVQARWDELKSEMDGLREEGRKAWDERNGLFEKRNELQKQMVSERVRATVEVYLSGERLGRRCTMEGERDGRYAARKHDRPCLVFRGGRMPVESSRLIEHRFCPSVEFIVW